MMALMTSVDASRQICRRALSVARASAGSNAFAVSLALPSSSNRARSSPTFRTDDSNRRGGRLKYPEPAVHRPLELEELGEASQTTLELELEPRLPADTSRSIVANVRISSSRSPSPLDATRRGVRGVRRSSLSLLPALAPPFSTLVPIRSRSRCERRSLRTFPPPPPPPLLPPRESAVSRYLRATSLECKTNFFSPSGVRASANDANDAKESRVVVDDDDDAFAGAFARRPWNGDEFSLSGRSAGSLGGFEFGAAAANRFAGRARDFSARSDAFTAVRGGAAFGGSGSGGGGGGGDDASSSESSSSESSKGGGGGGGSSSSSLSLSLSSSPPSSSYEHLVSRRSAVAGAFHRA